MTDLTFQDDIVEALRDLAHSEPVVTPDRFVPVDRLPVRPGPGRGGPGLPLMALVAVLGVGALLAAVVGSRMLESGEPSASVAQAPVAGDGSVPAGSSDLPTDVEVDPGTGPVTGPVDIIVWMKIDATAGDVEALNEQLQARPDVEVTRVAAVAATMDTMLDLIKSGEGPLGSENDGIIEGIRTSFHVTVATDPGRFSSWAVVQEAVDEVQIPAPDDWINGAVLNSGRPMPSPNLDLPVDPTIESLVFVHLDAGFRPQDRDALAEQLRLNESVRSHEFVDQETIFKLARWDIALMSQKPGPENLSPYFLVTVAPGEHSSFLRWARRQPQVTDARARLFSHETHSLLFSGVDPTFEP